MNYYSNTVTQSNINTAILSAESAFSHYPDTFEGYTVKILCYFRSYFSYLSSFYKQVIKEGARVDLYYYPFFKDVFLLGNIERYLKAYGIRNCIFKNYDVLCKNDTIIHDFMEKVGITHFTQLIFPTDENVSPPDVAIIFLYKLSFLPIPFYDFLKISTEIQTMDLSKYQDFHAAFLPKGIFPITEETLRKIRRQGELLHDPTWFDYCMAQKDHYAGMEDRDLDPHVQHAIFQQLSPEAQEIIARYHPAARNSDVSRFILPSMEHIPDEYRNMLITLREGYCNQHKNVLRLEAQVAKEHAQSELLIEQHLQRRGFLGKLFLSRLVMLFSSILSQKSRAILFISGSGLFDAPWYTFTYPDVAEAGLNPVAHYVWHGAKEHRNPTPWFNTPYYLNTYPDVAASGINPFYHYLRYGCKEGRKAQ